MALEFLGVGFAFVAVIGGFTLAGMSVLKRGGSPTGATGTLASALSMLDPASGAPTRQEAAAAREELKQQRHESTQAGSGPDSRDTYRGKIILPSMPPQAGPVSQPRRRTLSETDSQPGREPGNIP